ncbi:MAG TPA: ATP-binding protein [Herbaspirillum sp.]|jgi:two-component system sensor histidine kinase GlrK
MSNPNRIRILSRCSFRQLLLVAFLLIAGLLVATSVRALFTLESVAAHSRQASRQAVAMTEHLQRLQERTVAMERAARQFLVLNDPIFRERYQEAAAQAQVSLDAVAADMPDTAKDIVVAWKDNRIALSQVLEQPAAQRGSAAADVQRALARLPALNQQLSDQSDVQIGNHNDALLEELDEQRAMLSWQVIGAIVLAVLLACVFGLWLSMPLAQLEAAIDRLGSGRFDTPVAIQGPADLRRLGQQLDWLRQRLAKLQAEKLRFVENVARRLRTSEADSVSLPQVADVLDYHEAVLQAQQVHRLPIDLRVLLNKIVDDHRAVCKERGIRVEVSGSAGTLGLDLAKMEYVLGCLLSNAVRFSPPAGVVRIVLAQGERRGVQLDCIDQGPGVAAEDAPYIFDPFHPARPMAPGELPGAPVSLAVAREYIEAHHGSIMLLPSAAGAHFRITLPDEY